MEEEKIVNEIVDEIIVKTIEKELPQDFVLCPNNYNNIQYYNNKKEIINISSKRGKKEEKNDIVKKFIGKKERKSKTVVNNDNIGLYLEQDRSDNTGWIVYIKDLSDINNPRMERKKFGDNYKEAEKYYGKLFFKYQFNEIKKDVEVIKDEKNDSESLSSFMIKNRNGRLLGEHRFQGAITGMVGGAGISFSLGSLGGMWMPISFFIPFIFIIMMFGTAGGGILGYLTFDNLIKAFP